MAATLITDLVDPEVLTEAISARFAPGVEALWGTKAVVMNDTLGGEHDRIGTQIKVPYFGSIGAWEKRADGAAFTPRKITQTEETAEVQCVGIAIGVTDWARMVGARGAGGKDPYEEAADQAINGFHDCIDKMLCAAAMASCPEMTIDVYNHTTPRTIDSDLIIDGRAKWGDEAGERALFLCHSKVENDMWKLKDTTGRHLVVSPQTGGLSQFMGYPVGVSDLLKPEKPTNPSHPLKYTSLLINPGAMVCWYSGAPKVETDRDILASTNNLVISTYVVVHRYLRMPGKTKPGVAILIHN